MARQVVASTVSLLLFLQAFTCVTAGLVLANSYIPGTAAEGEGGGSSFLTFAVLAAVGVVLACAGWRILRSPVTGVPLPRWAVLVPLVINSGFVVLWAIAVFLTSREEDLAGADLAASTFVMVPVIVVLVWGVSILRGSATRTTSGMPEGSLRD